MKRLAQLLAVLLLLGGCAHLGFGNGEAAERVELWNRAQEALAAQEFATAEAMFLEIRERYPDTLEAQESLFYLGAIHIDPRNADWDPRPAEERLTEYLSLMDEEEAPRIYRYPEARTLHEIARQLNLPPDSRVAALQPEERVVTIEERVVVPGRQSRELAAEVEDLRRQVAERDARIRQQAEELERIRRTLTGPGAGAGAGGGAAGGAGGAGGAGTGGGGAGGAPQ